MCRGRYTGHPLHHIEHRSLNLQQAELLAPDLESDVAFSYVVAVVEVLLDAALGVEVIDDLLGHLYTGEDTFLFDDELLAALRIGRDATES